MPELPVDLRRSIADSEVEVVSWSGEEREMVLRVSKERGEESDVFLRLEGVRLVHMQQRFKVRAVGLYDRPFPDYLHLQLEEGEFALAFQEQGNEVYVVTAHGLTYDKIA